MISKKTQAEVDRWENKTGVFVAFGSGVMMEGTFSAEELSEIIGIQRRRLKELQPSLESKQKGWFDE